MWTLDEVHTRRSRDKNLDRSPFAANVVFGESYSIIHLIGLAGASWQMSDDVCGLVVSSLGCCAGDVLLDVDGGEQRRTIRLLAVVGPTWGVAGVVSKG